MFKVGAVHKSGIKLSEQIVSADEMQNMKWLLNRWGALGAAQPKQNVLSKICHAIMLTKGEVKYKCRNGHHEREGSFTRKNDKRGDSRRTFDDDCRSQKSLIRNRQKANVLYPERE